MQFCLSGISCLFYCLVIKFLLSLIGYKHKSFFLLWRSILDSGCLFSFVFQAHSLRLQNGHSVLCIPGKQQWTTLVLVTVLLMFLYFLVLPWMCLCYCFLNLGIAFYLNKWKPVHAFFPPSLSLDGCLRGYLPKNVPLEWFS